MKDNIFTRMGDGERIKMSLPKVKEEIAAGVRDASERGQIPELSAEEQEKLFDILAESSRTVSVDPGEEVIVTDDGAAMLTYCGPDDSGVGIPISRETAHLVYERVCAADSSTAGHIDFSFKPAKAVINHEMNDYFTISQKTTIPLFYGSQPNMGLYFQPDGPFPNPTELMPMGKIDEALASMEKAAEYMIDDLVFFGKEMAEIGCEGLNFDTSGSVGDADFYAALQSIRNLKEVLPDLPIIIGSASEFIMGMHGNIEFDGRRLAGMYPHQQAQVAEAAGASIYGMAVNVVTTKSFPWNLARALTFTKATVESSNIPVHPNVGMGVCGIPMFDLPPIDCTSRVAKALVQIGKADGL